MRSETPSTTQDGRAAISLSSSRRSASGVFVHPGCQTIESRETIGSPVIAAILRTAVVFPDPALPVTSIFNAIGSGNRADQKHYPTPGMLRTSALRKLSKVRSRRPASARPEFAP